MTDRPRPDAPGPIADEDHETVAAAVAPDAPAPAPATRSRLLASLDAVNRFGLYVDGVADVLAIPRVRADEVLRLVDDPADWLDGPFGLVRIKHLPEDVVVPGTATGFVRHEPGTAFPVHRHLGLELSYVIQGRARMDDGQVVGPGDLVRMEPEEHHGFEALPGAPLIYLLVLREGIDVGGQVVPATDPRL